MMSVIENVTKIVVSTQEVLCTWWQLFLLNGMCKKYWLTLWNQDTCPAGIADIMSLTIFKEVTD